MPLLTDQQMRVFTLLLERGVFETTNGSVTLHFDARGELQSIERRDYLYSKRHEG